MKHLHIILAFMSLILLLLTACSTKSETVQEKDVVVEIIKKYYDLEKEDDYVAKIVCDHSASRSVLIDLGFSSDTADFYDQAYYESHALVAIVMKTGVSNTFSLESMKADNKELNVRLNKKIPAYVDDMLVNRGILVEVSRDDMDQMEDVKVSIHTRKE